MKNQEKKSEYNDGGTDTSAESSQENSASDSCYETYSNEDTCDSDAKSSDDGVRKKVRKLKNVKNSVNGKSKNGCKKQKNSKTRVIKQRNDGKNKRVNSNEKCSKSSGKSDLKNESEQENNVENLKRQIKELQSVNKQIQSERNYALKQALTSHRSNNKQVSIEEHINKLQVNLEQMKQLMEQSFKQCFQNKVTVEHFSMKCVPGNINPYFDMHHSLTPDLKKLVSIEHIFSKSISSLLRQFNTLLQQCIGHLSLSTHDAAIFSNLKYFCSKYHSFTLKYENHHSRFLNSNVNKNVFQYTFDVPLFNVESSNYVSDSTSDMTEVYVKFKKVIIAIVVEAISVIDYVYTNRSLKSKKIKMTVASKREQEQETCLNEFTSADEQRNEQRNSYPNNSTSDSNLLTRNGINHQSNNTNECDENIHVAHASDTFTPLTIPNHTHIKPFYSSKIILLDEIKFQGVDMYCNKRKWPTENEGNVELIYTEFRQYVNLNNSKVNDQSECEVETERKFHNSMRNEKDAKGGGNNQCSNETNQFVIRGNLTLYIDENYVFQILANPFWIPPVNHANDPSLNGLGTLNNVRMNNRYLYILRYVLHSMVHIFASMHPLVFNHSLQHPLNNDTFNQIHNKFEPFFIRNEL